MGRAKNKQKAKLKRRRLRKKKAGKNVPFNLANSSKVLKGIKFSYQYKINVHNCSFKRAEFQNTRYRSGHITNSSFKGAQFKGVDFIGVNLKKSNFSKSVFSNCIFFNCDLTRANFKNAIFYNTYFISCKTKGIKQKPTSNDKYIINHYPDFQITKGLEKAVLQLKENTTLEKYNILVTKDGKINIWLLAILLDKFTPRELINFFEKITVSNREQFFTFENYKSSLQNYYKRATI